MEAIEGDDSLWSYLHASIFARELTEFGAMWHGCNWSTHEILDDNPSEFPYSINYSTDENWDWLEPKLLEWKLQVSIKDGIISVTFFTYIKTKQIF
ncbi:MAG: hypothetical protein H0Z39_05490 [Peptococcaceae bacterium]|nr:hypothetical protein [Peptococcaceae bacterium]